MVSEYNHATMTTIYPVDHLVLHCYFFFVQGTNLLLSQSSVFFDNRELATYKAVQHLSQILDLTKQAVIKWTGFHQVEMKITRVKG